METTAGLSTLAMELGPWSCSQLVKLQKWVLSVSLLPAVRVACRAGVNENDLC